MKCPICDRQSLTPVRLSDELPALHCTRCGGHWLDSLAYDDWLQQHGENLPEKSAECQFEVRDTNRVLLCPNCRHLMSRYRVGHGMDFYLDRCGSCHSLWLDRNKWNALESCNLHDDIHLVFSDRWQRELRQERLQAVIKQAQQQEQITPPVEPEDGSYFEKAIQQQQERQEAARLQQFGAEDYAKLKRIRNWIDRHPERLGILRYLSGEGD